MLLTPPPRPKKKVLLSVCVLGGGGGLEWFGPKTHGQMHSPILQVVKQKKSTP